MLRWLKAQTYRMADVVTAVSEGVALELPALGVPADRIRVVYNPVVTPDVLRQAAEELDHPWFREAVPVVLACGRLVTQKDYPVLIRAFARVRETIPARLVILGEGEDEAALRDLVHDLGLEADVWFAGFDVNPFRYMARCTCFVLSCGTKDCPEP